MGVLSVGVLQGHKFLSWLELVGIEMSRCEGGSRIAGSDCPNRKGRDLIGTLRSPRNSARVVVQRHHGESRSQQSYHFKGMRGSAVHSPRGIR